MEHAAGPRSRNRRRPLSTAISFGLRLAKDRLDEKNVYDLNPSFGR